MVCGGKGAIMCGRYNFSAEESREISKIIEEVQRKYGASSIKTGEIYPTNQVAVLVQEQNELQPQPVIWGFPNFRSKSGVIINARSETAEEKRTLAESLKVRRCVVPTSGFYEWTQDKDKTKYLFHCSGGGVLYLAGLYNDYGDERRMVILTTAANKSVSDIHNRMPVVLSENELSDWVGNPNRALEILHRQGPLLEKVAVS